MELRCLEKMRNFIFGKRWIAVISYPWNFRNFLKSCCRHRNSPYRGRFSFRTVLEREKLIDFVSKKTYTVTVVEKKKLQRGKVRERKFETKAVLK